MTRAYSESYLSDAKHCLGGTFDYALTQLNWDPDEFCTLFLRSRYAELFECGHPGVVAGMSGIELAQIILEDAGFPSKQPPKANSEDSYPPFQMTPQTNMESKAYWAGFVLADYQWRSGRRFQDIFKRVPLSDVLALYPLFHEMDVERFAEEMERRLISPDSETNLAWLRENRQLSQARLASISGVGLRSIQMYEQRVNDINKAQAITLYRLAHALLCDMEDLLENPTL